MGCIPIWILPILYHREGRAYVAILLSPHNGGLKKIGVI